MAKEWTVSRITLSGTEYWSSIKKRSILVPTGKEKTDDYSFLDDELPGETEETEEVKVITNDNDNNNQEDDNEFAKELEAKNIKELKEYAKANGIELPADVKLKADIINHLLDNNE